MKEKILTDLKNAMKNQNKDLLNVVRMVKGAIQLEEIKVKRDLTDDEIVSVIAKQIKTRKETISELENTDRKDAVEQAKKEIAILEKYMPKMMDEDEITKVVESVFEEVKPAGPQDIGKVMGKVSALLKGKADMSTVNKIVKEKLN